MELESASGVRAQFLPSGALFALRHGPTLINQLLPGPAEDGLFRLLVRWRRTETEGGWAPLVGPAVAFAPDSPGAVTWATEAPGTLQAQTTFTLHATRPVWTWSVHARNTSATALSVDVLHAQDLGLADEAAVRSNEAYVSQYLDLLPVATATLGWVVLARQNEPTGGGRHPWLAVACATGAAAFCTDGWQFFGADHRLTGEPAAVRTASLPSRRLQYEFALAGLQSETVTIAPGAAAQITIHGWYVEDHPAASGPDDVVRLHEIVAASPPPGAGVRPRASGSSSVFVRAPWLHGAPPAAADWDAWFPNSRRHEERGPEGGLLAFFHDRDAHVAAREKEATVLRPHGHILRSGEPRWMDAEHLGVTCYASGIFAAQAYLGNPNLARLLSVVRNHLNVTRAGGLRVFVHERDEWRQLGVPSAFAMTPGDARWLYKLADGVLEARLWCSADRSAAFVELRVTAGEPREFLVTHQLALGANELDAAGELEVHEESGWIECRLDPAGVTATRLPGLCFAIAAADPETVAAVGGDELVYADRIRRGGPYAVVHTKRVRRAAIVLLGSLDGAAALPAAVAAARAEYTDARPPARALPPPVRVAAGGTASAAVARLDAILPWLTHNAGIHFSAAHGLEQYGGAAWGVRDVCQGSLEWLLAAGEFAAARRMLATVFAQQYPQGGWPQWFMHRPFHAIQHPHSHGDVCFWPVKALCDYAEATNDLDFLADEIGYTDPERFEPTGVRESLWRHCDRVLAHCEGRFADGTALVNYGDGDWDDTLQPADPTLRTRMVSAWTVALAYQTFRQLAEVCRRGGEPSRASRLQALLARMREDFRRHLMPDGTVAGFLVRDADGTSRPLLHPADQVTGIRYRLLPMTRAVLAELFTADEARHHLDIVARELKYADGVRLMSEPAVYRGGLQQLFRRAETAANVGREISLLYVHAHLRYAEAMAKVGDADALWWALQVANPVGLGALVPQAAPRQSNVYFSSSDADFPDRLQARARWSELRTGGVAVRAGWRLYSSGPGLFLHAIRAAFLGVRESFGDVVFDPVLPRALSGLTAVTTLHGRVVEIRYRLRGAVDGPLSLRVNGRRVPLARDGNPYRPGGGRVAGARLGLVDDHNTIEIQR